MQKDEQITSGCMKFSGVTSGLATKMFCLWVTCPQCDLPPVNGVPIFERLSNKTVRLGCAAIWQDIVTYDELTINERQKSDHAFSAMLDSVRRGFPTEDTIAILQGRVIQADKFIDTSSPQGSNATSLTNKCCRISPQSSRVLTKPAAHASGPKKPLSIWKR